MKRQFHGYCTYNPSNTKAGITGEVYFENEKWYYAFINYGWNDGTGISSTDNCKYIEGAISFQDGAEKILNDFFETDK